MREGTDLEAVAVAVGRRWDGAAGQSVQACQHLLGRCRVGADATATAAGHAAFAFDEDTMVQLAEIAIDVGGRNQACIDSVGAETPGGKIEIDQVGERIAGHLIGLGHARRGAFDHQTIGPDFAAAQLIVTVGEGGLGVTVGFGEGRA